MCNFLTNPFNIVQTNLSKWYPLEKTLKSHFSGNTVGPFDTFCFRENRKSAISKTQHVSPYLVLGNYNKNFRGASRG